MLKLALFGIFCLAAVLVSLCAKRDRSVMVAISGVVTVNWLLFAMPWIYAPAAPAFVAYAIGLPVHNVDAWAAVDLLSMMAVIGVGWRTWWAPLLWSPYLVKLPTYATAYAFGFQYVDYAAVLDMGLTVQLAILFMIGGGDCADYLLALGVRLRRLGRMAIHGFARSEAQ